MTRSLVTFVTLGVVAVATACSEPAATGDPTVSAPAPAPPAGDAGSPDAARGEADAGDGGVRPERCDRVAAGRTAPVSLFDAAKTDLASLPDAARGARVDRLLADVAAEGGAPLEDPTGDRVVILARGAPVAGSWAVTTSVVGFDVAKAAPMTAVAGTDLWAAELAIPRGTAFRYKLLSGSTFLEDPLARNVVWDGVPRAFGVRGELNAVGHVASQPASQGRVVALGKVHATQLENDRAVYVYFPPKYDDGTCAKLPSVVFHDGNDALTRGDFATAADALYAARPDLSAVLVFVDLPSQDVRMTEYGFGDGFRAPAYVDFLTTDLWPVVTTRARVCSRQEARGMSGASLGGLVSTFAAFEKPSSWGWIGAQSASYFWGENAMIDRVAASAKLPVRFYLDSGCPDDNCEVTDRMEAVMKQKGYDVLRIKQDGGEHEWSFWRARLGGMLTHFRDGQTACD